MVSQDCTLLRRAAPEENLGGAMVTRGVTSPAVPVIDYCCMGEPAPAGSIVVYKHLSGHTSGDQRACRRGRRTRWVVIIIMGERGDPVG